MLVVTRKVGQGIIIFTEQGEIRVSFEKQKDTQVGIGIDAPDEILILREELLDNYDFERK